MARPSSFKFGFDILMEKGPCPRPTAVKAWTKAERFEKAGSQKPFKYMADALCALSLSRLNPNVACPVKTGRPDASFCDQAWMSIDPHFELWKRSQDRVQSLRLEVRKVDAQTCAEFEREFSAALDKCLTPDGIDLKGLWPLIDSISHLESKRYAPLLYNFGLRFSAPFTQKLHYLYSLLFNLRSVVAVDWNAHVDDPSHEGVSVDSITDYIPKADYVVNDALLYWKFTRLAHPFVAGRSSDVKVEKTLVEPLKKAFHEESHNACHLIDQLPKTFLEKLEPTELEEALYLVQMDWLLGSEAGLLFRLREELYGLQNGYEKIFWHDLQDGPVRKAAHLSLSFELSEGDFFREAA